jgi:hypothetical protein
MLKVLKFYSKSIQLLFNFFFVPVNNKPVKFKMKIEGRVRRSLSLSEHIKN